MQISFFKRLFGSTIKFNDEVMYQYYGARSTKYGAKTSTLYPSYYISERLLSLYNIIRSNIERFLMAERPELGRSPQNIN